MIFAWLLRSRWLSRIPFSGSRLFLVLGVGLSGVVLYADARGATLLVTNINDSGAGSLRQAIIDSNATNGLDTINFQILGFGVHTIAPTSALPAINDAVVIDGTTQPGYAGQPLIEINGTSAGNNAGFRLQAGYTTIKGLIINRFGNDGIRITGPGTNVVQGNYLGTDPTGTIALGNTLEGVEVNGSSWNVIGGTNSADRNLISGNGDSGIYLLSATNTLIQGNYIGTTASGSAKLGNVNSGIALNTSGTGNLIGGTNSSQRNLISGNGGSGVYLKDGVTGNLVYGNYIGTSAAGTNALGNTGDGVTLQNCSGNAIGSTNTGAGNLLSGNAQSGVSLFVNAPGNSIQANLIGTDAAGLAAVGNGFSGVTVYSSSNNVIGGTAASARNIISGNALDGVFITNCTGTIVLGNYIGINVNGNNPLRNLVNGIELSGSSSNAVGSSAVGARNVISGNSANGVGIFFVSAGNVVAGNYIGTDATGAAGLSNLLIGARIESAGNTIGGSASGSGNVISGNALDGILVTGTASSNNVIRGNYVGTSASGISGLGNGRAGVGISGASGNSIGGVVAGAGNLLSANGDAGIYLMGSGTTGNLIQGNMIGAAAGGTSALGNALEGIYVERAHTNTIGGTLAGAGNLISGNHTRGIWLTNSSWNLIQGNLVGTRADGVGALGNTFHSVECESNACNNTIGGTGSAGNRIAFTGSGFAGVRVRTGATNNLIRGNLIFSNSALGISFTGLTPTVNDVCDADVGGNNQQNYPVLTQAVSGNGTGIRGTLNSKASSTFLLQFFANPSCDGSGNGEGEIFLGEKTIVTGSGCSTNFVASLVPSVPPGYVVTATATDAANNTSEFSACALVTTVPTIGIVRTNGTNGKEVALTWTNTATGFVLKQANSLSPPVVWTNVTNSVGSVGGQFVVTLPLGVTNRFYLLSFE